MKNRIDILLDKYFEAETSLNEERELQEYFSSGKVASDHLKYAPIFQFFKEEKHSETIIKKQNSKRKALWLSVAACAAGIALVFTVANLEQDSMNESLVYVDGKRISDPQSINNYVLESITDVQDIEQNVFDSQIEILDFFTED